MIEHRYTELAKAFQADHGCEPTTVEAIALHERANLETCVAKHEPRSLAEQRQQWRAQLIEVLGGAQALSAVPGRGPQTRPPRRLADREFRASRVADSRPKVIAILSASQGRREPVLVASPMGGHGIFVGDEGLHPRPPAATARRRKVSATGSFSAWPGYVKGHESAHRFRNERWRVATNDSCRSWRLDRDTAGLNGALTQSRYQPRHRQG